MAHAIGIVGASGYGGAELVRLLAGHPAARVSVVAAHAQAGEPVDRLFPNLAALPAEVAVFDAIDLDALGTCDLVVLATPHGPAIELATALVDGGTPVVDLSAAFRLPASDFAHWYGEEHGRPALLDRAVYGLTEYARDAVRSTALVANPGCYPTAALLGLLPIAGLLRAGSVVVDAKSGTSGAGRGLADHLHFAAVHGDLVAYGAPGHRHTGEIEHGLATLGDDLGPVSFTPHLVPMARGLLATCYGELRDGVTGEDVQSALQDRYRDEPFVHVLPPGTFPHTKSVHGSNGAQVSGIVDDRTGRVVVTTAIDNLGKGAAGQALQNANLMLGFDETLGLTALGIAP